MDPAKQVGGDFYDFFWVDENTLGFMIGDVAGKGVPAAILMAVTRTLIKATGTRGTSPEECMGHVNRILALESSPETLVTGIYGTLDTRTGEVRYANAGHNPPFQLKADGAEMLPNTGGVVLGVLPEYGYSAASLTLAPGETLYLYTDGVTEAMNGARELYGDERLGEYLRGALTQGPEGVRDVHQQVAEHAGGAPQHDDITMLALRFNGAR